MRTIEKLTDHKQHYEQCLIEAEHQLRTAEQDGARLRAVRLADRVDFFDTKIKILEEEIDRHEKLYRLTCDERMQFIKKAANSNTEPKSLPRHGVECVTDETTCQTEPVECVTELQLNELAGAGK